MSLPRKPSQGREMQFTTDFPPLPNDSAALEGWYRDLKTRLKSDQQTVEDAFAKLREQIGDASTSTQLAAMEARLLALENNPFTMPLIFNRHVSEQAEIVESKLALNHSTHSNANDPTDDQKAALVGTQGDPSATNKYVTNQDARLVTPDTGSALVLASMVREGARPLDETAEILLAMMSGGGSLNVSAFIRTLLDDPDATAARVTLGLVIGTNVQAFDAFLTSIAALGTAADRYLYTTGVDTAAEGTITAVSRVLLARSTIQLWNKDLGGQIPRYGRFCMLVAVNLNSGATDIPLLVDEYVSNARYRIDKIMIENASISVTTATVGVFTAVAGGGTTIAADQAIAGLTTADKWVALTLEAVVGTDVGTAAPLYFRVGTPQGAACTVNVHLFGWSFDVT